MDGYRDEGALTPEGGEPEAAWIWAAADTHPDPSVDEDGEYAAPADIAGFEQFKVHASASAPPVEAPGTSGTPGTAGTVAARGEGAHAARLALGMAVMAAERLGSPANDAFVVGVGLAQQTAIQLRGVAGRVIGPPSRFAARALDEAMVRSRLHGNSGPLARSRDRMERLVNNARTQGRSIVATGRADANSVIQAGVHDGMAWAEAQAVPHVVDGLVPHLVDSVVPKIVDGLLPHLVDSVVPQLIDGVMPEIRARVLPIIIDDLTNDPRLRELILEQSRGVVGEAAEELRSATATADDRVEQVFRRLVKGGAGEEPTSTEASQDS